MNGLELDEFRYRQSYICMGFATDNRKRMGKHEQIDRYRV